MKKLILFMILLFSIGCHSSFDEKQKERDKKIFDTFLGTSCRTIIKIFEYPEEVLQSNNDELLIPGSSSDVIIKICEHPEIQFTNDNILILKYNRGIRRIDRNDRFMQEHTLFVFYKKVEFILKDNYCIAWRAK
jgi:hypothetical protein